MILLIINSFLIFNIYIISGIADVKELTPEYGKAPNIDGEIDRDNKEWDNATKDTINLFTNGSQTDKGLPLDIWVMENDSTLYILIRFDLESHASTEFIGLLITEKDKEGNNDNEYVDGKIIQFNDINTNDYDYMDYYLENYTFHKDSHKDGSGAAKLDGNTVIYEFSIPVNNTRAEDDKEDVFLDYGEVYTFKIIYGESPNYPDDILKSNIVKISIEYPPEPEPRNWWIDVHNILCIIIFIGLTSLFIFYIYKIIVLNKQLERMRE
ncbi:MAG: hypothetical protein ACTSQP_14745 [Promethearchaeota archaeon]